MARKAKPWYHAAKKVWRVWWGERQRSLGVKDRADEAGAWAAFDRLKAGGTPAKKTLPKGLLSDEVERFLLAKAAQVKPYPVKPVTVEGYRKALTVFLALHGTDAELTADAIETRVVARKPTWGDNSRRNYLAAVELFLRWVGRPLALSKPGRESAGAAAVIPEAVYHMAVGAARGDLRPLLVFLWNTGCRPSEAGGLTPELVDWDAGVIRLREHKNRGKGKPRVVYLSPAALDVLRGQRERHPAGLLFPNRSGTRWRAKALAQAVWRLSKRVGHRLTAYGHRHSYATRALEKGIPDVQVAALLGHGSTRMLHSHYSHLSENAKLLKDVAARVG